MPSIDKVIFVVDRKDLDYQTMKEYDRFEKGAANAPSGTNPIFKTTEQVLGDKLHTYTIVDAITDGNVLAFRIDFINTVINSDYIQVWWK